MIKLYQKKKENKNFESGSKKNETLHKERKKMNHYAIHLSESWSPEHRGKTIIMLMEAKYQTNKSCQPRNFYLAIICFQNAEKKTHFQIKKKTMKEFITRRHKRIAKGSSEA